MSKIYHAPSATDLTIMVFVKVLDEFTYFKINFNPPPYNVNFFESVKLKRSPKMTIFRPFLTKMSIFCRFLDPEIWGRQFRHHASKLSKKSQNVKRTPILWCNCPIFDVEHFCKHSKSAVLVDKC